MEDLKSIRDEALTHILTKETIMGKPEGEYVQGLCVVQNYSILPQKNGGRYISGTLQMKGSVPFKSWGNSDAFNELSTKEAKPRIMMILGQIDCYGGVKSIIVEKAAEVEEGISEAISTVDFLEDVYNAEQLMLGLSKTISTKCSEGAALVFNSIMESVEDRFKVEFAAVSHHDNVKSGLLAHTFKVVRLATVLKLYPELSKVVSADILYLGCALHDIGKIYEYANGAMSQRGKVLSHHTFGVMMLLENRAVIEKCLGSEALDTLLSIVEQHHGEYGERPRTVAAYIIHKLDMLESTFTSLDEVVKNSADGTLLYDGLRLSF